MEHLEIEAVEENMALGASIFSNLIGGSAVDNCKFVARGFAPGGESRVVAEAKFQRWGGVEPLDFLTGQNRQEALKVLSQLDAVLVSRGWCRTENGSHWYSYRYELGHEIAGRGGGGQVAASVSAPITDVADQLAKLASLRDQGILTDEEFAAQKAKILS